MGFGIRRAILTTFIIILILTGIFFPQLPPTKDSSSEPVPNVIACWEQDDIEQDALPVHAMGGRHCTPLLAVDLRMRGALSRFFPPASFAPRFPHLRC